METAIEVKDLIIEIQTAIDKVASIKTKEQQEKYMKEQEKYRGVKSPGVNEIFKHFWREKIKDLSIAAKKSIAHQLLSEEYSEDKYIGALIFEKIQKEITLEDIKKIEKLFVKGEIHWWANCDLICGKILKPFHRGNKKNTEYIASWKDSKCLWLQRASCVAFVNLAKKGDKENFKGFIDILIEICKSTIKNPERFVQLGTGWLLREIGVYNKKLLTNFIEEHIEHFSREGLRYAIEKLSSAEQKKMTNLIIKPNIAEIEEETNNQPKKKKKK